MRRWSEQMAKLFADIRSGALRRSYRSEPVEPPLDGPLKKAVGANYNDIVNDTHADVVVLLLKPRSHQCALASRKLWRFAFDLNRTDYIFVTLDHTANQIEGGFPAADSPCVVLYPADKKDIFVLPFESRQYLSWLTKKHATRPHTMPLNITSAKKLAKAEARVEELAQIVKPELVARLRATMAELKADVAAAIKAAEASADDL
jgi:hypothetical protein